VVTLSFLNGKLLSRFTPYLILSTILCITVIIIVMNELSKNSKNNEVIALLKLQGITIGSTPVIIDIRPTKTAGKSTIFCIAEVELGEARSDAGGIDTMNAFELMGQAFTPGILQRGKMTVLDTVAAANGLAKGTLLTLKDEKGVQHTSCLRVYEQFHAYHDAQKPVAYKDAAGALVNKLKDGKPYFRATKIVPGAVAAHELL
jgi:hypothetical protein